MQALPYISKQSGGSLATGAVAALGYLGNDLLLGGAFYVSRSQVKHLLGHQHNVNKC